MNKEKIKGVLLMLPLLCVALCGLYFFITECLLEFAIVVCILFAWVLFWIGVHIWWDA